MLQIKYQIHLILNNKYLLYIKLIIILFIYFLFSLNNISYCLYSGEDLPLIAEEKDNESSSDYVSNPSSDPYSDIFKEATLYELSYDDYKEQGFVESVEEQLSLMPEEKKLDYVVDLLEKKSQENHQLKQECYALQIAAEERNIAQLNEDIASIQFITGPELDAIENPRPSTEKTFIDTETQTDPLQMSEQSATIYENFRTADRYIPGTDPISDRIAAYHGSLKAYEDITTEIREAYKTLEQNHTILQIQHLQLQDEYKELLEENQELQDNQSSLNSQNRQTFSSDDSL